MANFYNRRVEILINGEVFIAERGEEVITSVNDVRQFRITFDVEIDFGGYNSYADIAIYNLSDDTIGRLIQKNNVVTLRAGYDDNIDAIFIGKITNSFKERNGPDRLVRMLCKGGSQPRKSINKAIGANAKVTQLIKACVAAMDYPIVISEDDFDQDQVYLRGSILYGDPRDILDDLAKRHDFSYVIENDTVICVKNSSTRPNAFPILISEDTGMQGIPEITFASTTEDVGCNVSSRLNPQIRMGGQIEIDSKLRSYNFGNLYFQDIPPNAGSGIYRVFRLHHSGDTYGDAWTTSIEAIR